MQTQIDTSSVPTTEVPGTEVSVTEIATTQIPVTEISAEELPATERQVSNVFRWVGRIAFWLELGLAIAAGLALLCAISGRNFGSAEPGIGIGIFWGFAGGLFLVASIYLAFRYTRIAKQLASPNVELHPSKTDINKLLRMGAIGSLVGMLLCLIGGGATIGMLLAKSVSQPPGVTLTDPNNIIQAVDIFVAIANFIGISGHFVGASAALALLDWMGRE